MAPCFSCSAHPQNQPTRYYVQASQGLLSTELIPSPLLFGSSKRSMWSFSTCTEFFLASVPWLLLLLLAKITLPLFSVWFSLIHLYFIYLPKLNPRSSSSSILQLMCSVGSSPMTILTQYFYFFVCFKIRSLMCIHFPYFTPISYFFFFLIKKNFFFIIFFYFISHVSWFLRKPEGKETRVPQCSSQHCL